MTAYELRISDWSSGVCSSDLPDRPVMVVLGDDARLDVELFAPSRAIGFARVGERVRLMYDAFPYQQFGTFGGTVTRISRTALGPDEIAAPLSIDEPAYRIRVRLDAQAVRADRKRTRLNSSH